MNKLLITPKTKIHDLLETYPRLEDELIAAAPPFRTGYPGYIFRGRCGLQHGYAGLVQRGENRQNH